MDSFELNKIIGAILGTLLFVMGVGFIAEAIYAPAHSAGPGYDLPAPTEDAAAGATTGGETVKVADLGTLLAAADPKAGAAAAKKCASCHDFTEGGPNKAGPNLYGVVGRPIAAHPGFSYSDALKAHSADSWTYENLNTWLTSPKAYAPGTKMTYAGDKDDAERASIIAYLASLSPSAPAFPAPAAAEGGNQPNASQIVDNTASGPAATDMNAASTPASDASASAAPASEAPAAAAPAASSAPASDAPAAAAAPEAPSSSEALPSSSIAAMAPAAPLSSEAAPAVPSVEMSSSASQ